MIASGILLYVTAIDGIERRYIVGFGKQNPDGTATWDLIPDPEDSPAPEESITR
jgi:hypothetical protein